MKAAVPCTALQAVDGRTARRATLPPILLTCCPGVSGAGTSSQVCAFVPCLSIMSPELPEDEEPWRRNPNYLHNV